MHEIKCVLIGLLFSSGSNFCVLNYGTSDTDNGFSDRKGSNSRKYTNYHKILMPFITWGC